MRVTEIIVYLLLAVLAVIPDPLDVFDAGLPLIEVGIAIIYYWANRNSKDRGGGK